MKQSQPIRILSFILVLALLLQIVPMQTFAVNPSLDIVEELQISDNPYLSEDTEEAHVLNEITEKRTEFTKEFKLSNGTNIVTVYPNAVHYMENDVWKDIDNRLQLTESDTGNVYTNTAGDWKVSFPQELSAEEGISILKGNYRLSFRLNGELHNLAKDTAQTFSTSESREENALCDVAEASLATAVVETVDMTVAKKEAAHPEMVLDKLNSRLRYTDVYDNTDIVYDLASNQIKESIVLSQYDDSLFGYRYQLEMGNLVPRLANNQIELYDPDGNTPVMVMPAPYLVDDAGEYCYDVSVSLKEEYGKYSLKYYLPKDWLADDTRQWPVILDPVVETVASNSNAQDETFYENYASTHGSSTTNCGYEPACGAMRLFIKYSNLPKLTSADVIVNASFEMYAYEKNGSSSAVVEVHRVTESWSNSDSKTHWGDQPSFSSTIVDYATCSGISTLQWDITDIVRRWYSGSNYGMMFKVSNSIETGGSNNWMRFYSSTFTSTHKPVLTIVYRNNNGLENYWDYTTSSAGRAGTGYINNYTGNLVWVHEDMGFDGTRMPVTINHIYNANDSGKNSFGLGYGWRTNYNQRVYEWDDENYYVWEDGDGTAHYFKKVSSGTYEDEDGLELTLTTTGSGDTTYRIKDKFKNYSYFDANGRLTKQINNQKTKSSIKITYASSTSKRISTITDGVGRVYYFAYTDSLLTQLYYKGTNSTTVLRYIDYTYSGKKLTKITYMDGEVSQFKYADNSSDTSKNLISKVTDIDGYSLSYTYNTHSTGKPARVASVSEADGTVAGGSLEFSYGRNRTKCTDASGNVQTMQFNNWGNTISVYDNLGRAQYADYSSDDPSDGGKGNQLKVSSKMQNTVGNRIKNSNFDLDVSWSNSSDNIAEASVSGTAYSGNKSMKITTAENSVEEYLYSGTYSVAAGTPVTFSAYVKTGAAPTWLAIDDGTTVVKSEVLAADSDWTRLQVTYTNTTEESVSVRMRFVMEGAGESYVDCAQLENAASASRFNLVGNGDFRSSSGYWSSYSGRTTYDTIAAPELSSNVYKFTGSPTSTKRISQTIPISGSKGDAYVMAGWGKAYSAPLRDSREFGIVAIFNNTDDTTTTLKLHFNPSVSTWQYASRAVVAKKDYDSITIRLAYDYNVNTAYFDGIQLFKESFGTSYAYDDDGNVTKVTDLQSHNTKYDYDSNGDLEKVTLPSGATMTYTYDDYHNVLTSTTTTGVKYSYEYDDYGNNTAIYVADGDEKKQIYAATYTESGHHRLESTTDSSGNVTSYNRGYNTDCLYWVQSPNDTEATRTNYTYDEAYRLMTGASATTDTGTALQVGYTYDKDLLTAIETASTAYSFTYGNFSLRSAVRIGGRTLAEYGYEDVTNYLISLDYGNGDGVDYTYNQQGQVTRETYEDGDTVSYRYDNSGALASVADSATGIIQYYTYDLIDRLGQYRETGDGYEATLRYSYNKNNHVSRIEENTGEKQRVTTFVYDDDDRISTTRKGSSRRVYSYDDYSRVSGKTAQHVDTTDLNVLEETFTYRNPVEDGATSQVETYRTASPAGYDVTYSYTYDGNGNILTVSDGTNTTSYVYDTANQLLRENNQAAGKTWGYVYDDAGNILRRLEYAYTTGELGEPIDTVVYTYGDEEWGDLLTAYDGQTITHDAIGNPLTDGTWTYTWEHGRELASMTDGETTWDYTYNADGLRTKRTNGTITYNYLYLGGQLVKETIGDTAMYFAYDADGKPMSVLYNDVTYYYVTNLQGDVVAILSNTGELVVSYSYDAWGNPLSTSGTMADTLGAENPLRYRGYVYDVETGLYYLQSRYYDPGMGRFINADVFASTGQGLLSNNMFAYCLNTPVNSSDYQGYLTISIGMGFGGNMFIGLSDAISIAFDNSGNIEIQKSYSSPRQRETTSIGLFNFGESKFIQITNKSDVSELTSVSTYLGFSNPSPVGFDIVCDAPVADPNGEMIGVQLSKGWGVGVDVHVSQTFTETICRFTWKDIFNWTRQLFAS